MAAIGVYEQMIWKKIRDQLKAETLDETFDDVDPDVLGVAGYINRETNQPMQELEYNRRTTAVENVLRSVAKRYKGDD